MIWSLVSGVIFLFAFAVREFVLRKRTESAFTLSQNHIQQLGHKINTIVDNAPIVFSVIDRSGIFLSSEGKGLENLGRKANQSVGVSIYDVHNRNPVILDAVSRAFNGERVETSFVLNDISYDLFMGPDVNADGVVIGASMLSVDITDRKRIDAEKAQALIREHTAIETSKLKSEFLATMSHEIRTPLNGVIGMTFLLLDTQLNAQQREYAESIKDSGAGLLGVINDILDFSKIEAGKLEFEDISFNLPELIQKICKTPKIFAIRKDILFTTEVSPALQTWVRGDPGRFRQILNNLIGNAIKFTNKGQVVVRVVPSMTASLDKVFVRIEVEDTGVGLSEAAVEKMFVPFSQGEASMARRYGGSGLGLSISKQLVEKMGGQIGVRSIDGKGSVFWFELAFRVGSRPMETLVKETAAPFFFADDVAPKILVAEDNKVNQLITVRMLEKMGCTSVIVADGFEAIAALANSKFDLVLMDCQMPNLDGLAATRRIRAETGPNREVPIIAMTANAMKGDKEICIAAGMDAYVTKPVSYEALRGTVTHWLENRRASKRPA